MNAKTWLCVAAALAAGESAGFALSRLAGAWPAAAALAVAAAVAAVAFDAGRFRVVCSFASVCLAGLALSGRAVDRRTACMLKLEDSPGLVRCDFEIPDGIYTAPAKRGGTYVSFPARIGPLRVSARCVVPDGGDVPAPGETWSCEGRLENAEDTPVSKPVPFWIGGEDGLVRRNVGRRASVCGTVEAVARSVRKNLSRRAGIGLENMPGAAELNRAILLGEKRGLDKNSRSAMAAAGTIHVFAISGLHVIVVSNVFAALLFLAGMPARVVYSLLIPAVWFYVYMVGHSPSAVRAAAMATLYCLAPLNWRRPDAVVAWAVSFVAVHVFSPDMLFDVSNLLSFAVMLAIAVWLRWGRRAGGGWKDAFMISMVAWAASVPITAHCFGRFTAGGLVTNIVALPAATASIVSGMLGILASFVSDTVAAHLNAFAAIAVEMVSGVSRVVAATPLAGGEIAPWPLPACMAWYFFLLALFLVVKPGRRCSIMV